MRVWLAVILASSACGFPSLQREGASNASIDAATADSRPPDTISQLCYGNYPQVCFATADKLPTAQTTISGLIDIDTDAEPADLHCDQNNDNKDKYCVVVGNGLEVPVGNTLQVHGSKALILLSTTSLSIGGLVDVSSHTGTSARGAGGSPNDQIRCPSSPNLTLTNGGSGGSFQTPGGPASDGQPVLGMGADQHPATIFPVNLVGGCAGDTVPNGGQGGDGGGAISIITAETITISGHINASGAGGHAGPAGNNLTATGGGGGGAGGMIILDSPVLPNYIAGLQLWANGGAGGVGGDTEAVQNKPGVNGSESEAPNMAAPTTSRGSTHSADGGRGSIGNSGGSGGGGNADTNSGSTGGGGGGGGGGGFIYAPGLTDPNMISPPSSPTLPSST